MTLQDCQKTEVDNENTSLSCGSSHSLEFVSSVGSVTEEHVFLHNAEVHVSSKEEKKSQNVILASASKEGRICIWDTENGRSMVNYRMKSSYAKNDNFIYIAWTRKNTIISNSRNGGLMMFTLLNKDSDEYTLRSETKTFHTKQGVVALCPSKTNPEVVWTISYNRELICENIRSGKLVAKYSCASTGIACLKERNDDMNK